MSVFFISDPHLGHKNILKFTGPAGVDGLPFRGGSTVDEHDEWVISCLQQVATKRTYLYILGDVGMKVDRLELFNEVPGTKHLVLGNHDLFPISTYIKYFDKITGGFSKYGMWITHMPIHPNEMRGRLLNIHGHTHLTPSMGKQYINCCIEWLKDGIPLSLDLIRARHPELLAQANQEEN